MKQTNCLVVLLFVILVFESCGQKTNGKIKINADWKFKLVEESSVLDDQFQSSDYDDSAWENVSLPHTAHLEPLVVNDQWQGICWYRKSLIIPQADKGKKIIIELEAAMSHAKIWLNGVLMTVHQGGYLPVVIDATKYVKKGEKNTLAIRLNNTDNPITGPKPLKKLDFNMYGGLYRNAWLIIKNGIHISHPILANKEAGGGVFITYPKVSEKESILKVKTHVENESREYKSVELQHSVFYNGELVSKVKSKLLAVKSKGDFEFIDDISIPNSKLWSPKNPNLYKVETCVFAGGKLVDKETNQIGIREFTFKNNELYINGKKTFLRGVNRHQEYPFIGYALSDNAQYRDAKKIKDAGFNYIRLSHYPQSPAFMDACDELGIVVMDAILGWQYYLDNDLFRAYCYRSSTELIRRDRNHPCVLAWEVSLNETDMPIPFMEELNRIVHAEYPGANTYSCGWKNDVYDLYLQARQHRLRHYDSIQTKPYVVSEYGDWEYYSSNAGLNQDKLSKQKRFETSSRQLRAYGEKRLLQQAKNIQEAHNDNFNTTAFADGYWVMYDYNRGYHDDIEASGIMDIYRLPKFSYGFYKSQKDIHEEVVLELATYWTKKSPLDVSVFSNCDQVKLFLNDSLIAEQKPDDNNISNNLAHPPFTFKIDKFEAGTLKAIGVLDGKQVVEKVVKTPGKAVKLKLWIDESGKAPQADCNDVLFLYIAAVDNNGTVVPDYSEVVNLTTDSDVEIMNVGDIKAEAGIATALIKLGESKGEIRFTASSGELKTKAFKFTAN
ncbi:glycoside hydrolase family 2 TIM barrel-domain containing protein [Ancylomarina sp. 16SWW S1-10-2]|uniref:glycoside hydrolase family 2 TIM barrel-domain containing protein n=1 Tax=Ancylomarina sp. 16SWW S1-10-2 TaxID=2499681 RepID=UPI0012AE1D1A|nr:glycoside hydrolase family 2 TIM barrel-domain containing protein [Ancylomarina sp. 16SWW S1-10-2]MRT91985.1 glycoside hydrolase family 2 protein [Ancylomarina sp. 16SWW S1-10-2]